MTKCTCPHSSKIHDDTGCGRFDCDCAATEIEAALSPVIEQRDTLLARVAELERELSLVNTHKRMLEQDYDRDRKAMIEAERINVVLNQNINSVIVEKIRVEQQQAALVGAAKGYMEYAELKLEHPAGDTPYCPECKGDWGEHTDTCPAELAEQAFDAALEACGTLVLPRILVSFDAQKHWPSDGSMAHDRAQQPGGHHRIS